MIPPAERFYFTKSVYLYFKSICYRVHFQDITLSKEQLSFKNKKKGRQTFLKGGFYQLLMEVGFKKIQ